MVYAGRLTPLIDVDVMLKAMCLCKQAGIRMIWLGLTDGIPVIIIRIPSMRDVVEEGVHGYLYEPGDPRSLTDTLLKIFSDEGQYERMRENVLKAANDYSWSKRAERFLSFISS